MNGMSAVVSEFRTQVKAEFRKPVLTLVEASWENPDGTLQTVPAYMEDTSAGGARIRIKTPIVVGLKLRIRWRHEHFSGTARYCRTERGEFLVGIQRDPTNSPIPDRPAPNHVPPQKSASTSDPLLSTVKLSIVEAPAIEVPTIEVPTMKMPTVQLPPVNVPPVGITAVEIQSPPKQQESKPNEILKVDEKAERDSIAPMASSTTTPARSVGHEIDNGDGPRSRVPDLDSPRPAEPRTELQTKQTPKQPDEGRKRMRDKWLELPWNKKHAGLTVSGPGSGEARNGNSAKENPMHDLIQPTQKAPVRSAREVPTFQVDLSPMEDIYRAAGIMDPRKGYSITTVVEMLHSAHIRDLSKEMKRAAVLMALDTAGIPIDQVQRDAKARQDALDSHEALQRKHVEAEWARKAEEIIQIQAELESIKAHYMARIGHNMEGVAREKETFAGWLTLKQQECQSMADAVELCLKSLVSAPASASSDGSMSLNNVQVSAKTV